MNDIICSKLLTQFGHTYVTFNYYRIIFSHIICDSFITIKIKSSIKSNIIIVESNISFPYSPLVFKAGKALHVFNSPFSIAFVNEEVFLCTSISNI